MILMAAIAFILVVLLVVSLYFVRCAQQVKAAFVSGNAHRATAGTFMNAQSSRSHAVLTLHIEQEIPVAPPPSNDDFEDRAKDAATISAAKGRRRRFVRSKFHFVDLAGRFVEHLIA